KDTLKDMHEIAVKDDLDLVVSGFYIETYYDVDKYITLDYIPKSNIYKDKESFRKDTPRYFDINMFYPPWNKMY
ncbi:MAG: glycosyltransferase family 2 protein, partial [Lachnospiraceae bacterium]|nr:glycosyltransferase family 2 protein [Lachnospiraceae bacterium]